MLVVGESRAGEPFAGEVKEQEAVHISTGAMLPTGADTVVRVEDTKESKDTLHIMAVRKKGQDILVRDLGLLCYRV